jgi:glycosyltransferase involved in cell wall biosynthesis
VRVSVILTVLNEGQSVVRLLASLAAQTRPADEIVIVDGGSSDDTVAIIRQHAGSLPLQLLVSPGANISRGRNLAIASASGEVIAATDAGVWLEPGWLGALVAPLEAAGGDGRRPEVAAGFFVPDGDTPFELAMGATVLPAPADVDPARFLPSSRSVAFTRRAWQAAGGYPEWLDYCEDLIFDLRLRAAAGPFAWAPDAIAHFRPRGSLRAFIRQYYRYARGDGKADLWRKRHAIRYGIYLIVLPLELALAVRSPWLGGGLLLMSAAAYCRAPYRRLLPALARLPGPGRLQALAWVPLIRLAGDLAKMAGYPAGWAWRLRRWRRPEIHSRMGEPSHEAG